MGSRATKPQQQSFNLFKELYLNKDNRDIRNTVIKYLCKYTRANIVMTSIKNYKTVCEVCYRGDNGLRFYYDYDDLATLVYEHKLCVDCFHKYKCNKEGL